MAEAARTVKYHVSDFLKDRHPYNRNQSFETQRERDAGKVFDGFDATGLQMLLSHILDSSISSTQRSVALRHLLAHSAAPEKKVVMLRSNIVGSLASIMSSESLGDSPIVESLVHQVLRSLCVLPQGCVAVMEEGAIPVILTTITRTTGEDRSEAQFHASCALSQICSNWAGRGWLLGQQEVVKEFELCSRQSSVLTDAQREQLPDDVINAMNIVMEKTGRKDTRLLQQISQALAALTLSKDGLHRTLIAGSFRVVSTLIASYSVEGGVLANPLDAEVVAHLATYVWHACLDPVGLKESLDQTTLVASLGLLLTTSNKQEEAKSLMTLKSALAGAVGALVLHPDLKKVSLVPLSNGSSVVAATIDLLRSVDILTMEVLDAQKAGTPPPFLTPSLITLTSVVKNCVQALRLIAELPAGRDVLHALLPKDEARSEKVRRMTFFSTVWQDEFNVSVY
ncbi:Hypothetical protein, putative [Bodo saltans]|uniref:Uncharacterized protein n=1 Tax=Bodo saltans TaxID=75058 RepID=A0A0S4IKI5_BODSA|nr:Hypothetical protein, putative [Bodo saltans]|eukprot:CUF08936.1 Hypothetical protein, putative [Bodo saltans]